MDDKYELLQSTALFAGLSLELTERVLEDKHFTCTDYAKGDTIYSPSCYQRAIGILCCGQAEVQSYSAGSGNVLNTLKRGSVFGAASLYASSSEYKTYITAKTACTVAFLGQSIVDWLIEEDKDFARRYIRFLCGRICFLNQKIAAFTAGTVEQRLAFYLCQLPRDEENVVRLPVTRKALADLLDVSRASLYRVMDDLVARGLIGFLDKRIVLHDPDKLMYFCERKEENEF